MNKKEKFKKDLLILMAKYNLVIYSSLEGDTMGIYDEAINFAEQDKKGCEGEILLSIDGYTVNAYEIKLQEN